VPVAQVGDGFADLVDVARSDLDGLLAEAQGCDDVLHASATLVAVDVAQPAHLLDAAHLDATEFLLDEHLVERRALLDGVVPDLDRDAPVLCAAGRRIVRGDGLLVAGPFIRDGLGG
jgi:hypothetical protein